jgi:hypothetical protein
VEVYSEKQTDILLKTNVLGSCPVHIERHTSLNYSWGVVSTDSLDGLSSEEIQTALAGQSVSEAYRLIGKRNGKPFPLQSVFLTFEVLTLASTIFIRCETVKVSLIF